VRSRRELLLICMASLLFFPPNVAVSENYSVIIRGKVILQNGSPPPIKVGIERFCSDGQGSAPGPLTDKNGEYLWRMDVDPMRTRSCVIRASHAGYTSTAINISALNGYLSATVTLAPIVITSPEDDPYTITMSEPNMPLRSKSELKAAMKALDARNHTEAIARLQKGMMREPKYAPGWHALGVVLDHENSIQESREAFEKAIAADNKFIPAYLTLVHSCSKLKDWECVMRTADALEKAEKKKTYPDVYFHRAVASFKLNSFDQAVSSIQDALRLDAAHRIPRAEYVYGRILEAKGDLTGAREHMSRYLDLDKSAPDPEAIRLHIENLGKSPAAGAEPELDPATH
jgi:hypothetical protein